VARALFAMLCPALFLAIGVAVVHTLTRSAGEGGERRRGAAGVAHGHDGRAGQLRRDLFFILAPFVGVDEVVEADEREHTM